MPFLDLMNIHFESELTPALIDLRVRGLGTRVTTKHKKAAKQLLSVHLCLLLGWHLHFFLRERGIVNVNQTFSESRSSAHWQIKVGFWRRREDETASLWRLRETAELRKRRENLLSSISCCQIVSRSRGSVRDGREPLGRGEVTEGEFLCHQETIRMNLSSTKAQTESVRAKGLS